MTRSGEAMRTGPIRPLASLGTMHPGPCRQPQTCFDPGCPSESFAGRAVSVASHRPAWEQPKQARLAAAFRHALIRPEVLHRRAEIDTSMLSLPPTDRKADVAAVLVFWSGLSARRDLSV